MRLLGRVIAGLGLLVLALAQAPPSARAQAVDPPWSVPEAELAAALRCPDGIRNPEREPVLLVHGTGTSGDEQWPWNYGILLPQRGFDVCWVTYPDRGLGDLQVSAEYVAYAIVALQQQTGRRVDVMGHSQGGLLPRWAVKFWPSARAAVDDVVLVAPPSHGTSVANGSSGSPVPMPAAFFQMRQGSQFIAALNAGDETPGDDVDWSVLYTDFDELVQPVSPLPTAALDWQREGPNVRNVRVQDVCPGRFVEHLTIGTTDRLSQELVLDAFTGEGPVDPARLGPVSPLCVLPDQYTDPQQLAALAEQLQRSLSGGFPSFNETTEEPALAPYAQAALDAQQPAPPPPPASEPERPAGPAAADPTVTAARGATAPGGSTLPATGAPAAPALAAMASALVALSLRLGRRDPWL